MKFPNRIPEYALKEGMNQTEIRKKVGYSHSHFNAIWNGKRRPTLEGMEKISKLLKIPVSKLFFL